MLLRLTPEKAALRQAQLSQLKDEVDCLIDDLTPLVEGVTKGVLVIEDAPDILDLAANIVPF